MQAMCHFSHPGALFLQRNYLLFLAINASCIQRRQPNLLVESTQSIIFETSQVEMQGQVEGLDDPEVAVYKITSKIYFYFTNAIYILICVGIRGKQGYIQGETITSSCHN